ncbi:MAG: SCO family protein [Betaproteobacteria bacterium]|nr:MAG: SCO family protein [Betaproteobacteria bacterium]
MNVFRQCVIGLALLFSAGWCHAQGVTPQLIAERDATAREYFTDTVLMTHTGKSVRFYSDTMKGKVVLINFIYTSCGDACPMITAKLMQAQKEVGELFGTEVRFISISIDPLNDTPAALSAFAKKMDVSHPEWLFLTGEQRNVDYVVAKLGAYTEEVPNHFIGMIMGSAQQARWKKVRPDAPPQAIAQELRSLAEAEAELRSALASQDGKVSQLQQ